MAAYEQYKDSGVKWLGEIPSHWEVGNMRQFFTERKELSETGQEMLLSVSEYKGITPAVNESGENVSRSASLVGYKKCYAGDLIINIMLAWKRGLAISSYDGIVSPAYCVFTSHNIIPAYANYLLRTDTYVDEFKRNSTGIIDSRLRMYPDDFKNIKCIAPPIEEQKAIVAYLDRVTKEIDRAIEVQQQMIDALNERIQIIISNAVTKGLNPDAPLRDSSIDWLGQIPVHWKVEPFGRHFMFGRGLGITKADLTEFGIPIISYGQIHAKYNTGTSISDDMVRYVPDTYLEKSSNCLLSTNDFVFADTSEDVEGSGNFAFNNRTSKIFAGYHTIIARPIDLAVPKYFAYLFLSIIWKSQIQSLVNAVKVYSIGKGILKRSYLLMPTPEEQQNISKYLDSVLPNLRQQIENCKHMIDLLTERKQIFINRVVTGKEKVI